MFLITCSPSRPSQCVDCEDSSCDKNEISVNCATLVTKVIYPLMSSCCFCVAPSVSYFTYPYPLYKMS